jgi:anti-sigma regulatory factor (Ser/Thr protein kinase)
MRETPFGHPRERDIGETDPGGGIDARAGRPGIPAGAGGPVLGAITLARRPEEVATARRFVAKILGDRPETATALLLTSEAVTNAVIHTDSATVRIMVIETLRGLRLEITDEGGETVPAANHECDLREGQRGVFLLQTLSVRSGYNVDAAGLTYWFEL